MIKLITDMVRVSLLSFIIGACATSKTVVNANGTEHQHVSCLKIEDCYREAKKVCGGSYKVINTTSESSGLNGELGSSQDLLVRCVSLKD